MALHPAFGGPEASTVTTTPRIRVNGMCATDYRSPRPSQQYVQGTLDVSREHGLTDGNAPAGTVRRCSNAPRILPPTNHDDVTSPWSEPLRSSIVVVGLPQAAARGGAGDLRDLC